MDLIQYKANLYFGNGVDALKRWTGSAGVAATTVALLVAPTVAPGTDAMQVILETFDHATPESVWTEYNAAGGLDDTKITLAQDADEFTEGAASLQATFLSTSRNFSAQKVFSSAATVDLSRAENLLVWYKANNAGINFKLGVMKNGASTVDFSLFQTFKSVSSDDWKVLRVPLSGVAAADRTASPGLGFQLIGPGRKGYNAILHFDQGMSDSGLSPDTYHYRMTYGVAERINNLDIVTRESNPGPEEVITLADFPPTGGVMLTPTTSGESGVNIIRFWRFRDHGTFRRARLVGTAPNQTTTNTTDPGSGGTSITLTTALGYTKGAVFQIGTEKMVVTDVIGDVLTITRGFEGTVAAAHVATSTVTFVKLLDTKSDGALVLEASEELVGDQIAPPVGYTHCLANDRLCIGNVTIASTRYPWRLCLSRQGFPEQFSAVQNPELGPDVPGWIDIPGHDHIRRVVEFDGDVLVLCDRSIWSLQGSGWDDFSLRQRAYVGLDARESVVRWGRLIFFLASDGVRVLAPNSGFDGMFETWLIDESVNSRARAMTAANRLLAAMGVDDLNRVWLCYARSGSTNNTALVFDPHIGDLSPQYNPKRRGWSYYTNITASVFHTLKRGGGDQGQLIGGSVSTGRIIQFGVNSAGSTVTGDDAGTTPVTPVAWSWQSKAVDAGMGGRMCWCYAAGDFDANAGLNITITPVLNGRASPHTAKLVLEGEHTGYALPEVRLPVEAFSRIGAMKVGASHASTMVCRGLRVGFYAYGAE